MDFSCQHIKLEKLVRWDHMAFSPDGRTFAAVDNSACGDPSEDRAGSIWIFRIGLPRPLKLIVKPERQDYENVAFSPDGRSLIAHREAHFFDHKHKEELVWFDTQTWEPTRVVEVHEHIQQITLLPKGERLFATDSYSTYMLFDVQSGEQLAMHSPYGHDEAREFDISPDEKWLALQGDECVRLVDLDSGEPQLETPLKRSSDTSKVCRFSDDGKSLVVGVNNYLAVLDVATGRILRYLRRKGELFYESAIFSPEGKFLIAAETKSSYYPGLESWGLRIWHVESGVEVQTVVPEEPFQNEDWELMAWWPNPHTLSLCGQTCKHLTQIDLSGVDDLEIPQPPPPVVPQPDYLRTTDKGQPLLQAILDDPHNLAPRKAAARWLAKNGDPDRAKFIQLQCSKKPEERAGADDILIACFDSWTAPLAEFKLGPEALEFRNGFPFSLTLGGSDVTDATLESLAAFPTLAELDLRSSGITDAGIAHLRALPLLRKIDLYETAVAHRALEHLRDHQHLQAVYHDWQDDVSRQALQDLYHLRNQRFLALDPKAQKREALDFLRRVYYKELKSTNAAKLDLGQCGITDADLCYLRVFPKLHTLSLFECPLATGEGFRHLIDLPIRELDLADTDIPTAEPLAIFPQLETLKFSDTFEKFDFATFRHLKNLPLKSLTFWGTNLTDDAIPHLLQLTSLEKLDLESCDITEAGAARLKEGLPNLKPRFFKHDWK